MVKADYEVTIYPTQAQGDAIHKIETEAGDYDLVVCSGGDGTLNEVVSGLMTITPEKRPELGYIPSGSTNDFASSLGLPKNMRKAAASASPEWSTMVGADGMTRRWPCVLHAWWERSWRARFP